MGKVYAVGIGPGDRAYYTEEACRAIMDAELVVGYTTYVELVRPYFPDKDYLETPMMQEVDRCRLALEAAVEGKRVAVVCSGDAGVYGMAGLLFELLPSYPGTEIVVVPGVTAALSGAAVLGAPLVNDFCVISLSDRLTPWDEIERKIRAAAEADFAVCFYNPGSKGRTTHLKRACEILMEKKAPATVCAYVRNIGREGEEKHILTLGELAEVAVDMFTTVFIGTKETFVIGDHMVTRRGYH